ncbi:hypothetical protein [Streptomyces sp. NPDC058614]|uniref:hypothetical protein n=1 Tax=Streptomyces sp. NPDC058614 TaxID=3346557 RepID=UPI00366351AB
MRDSARAEASNMGDGFAAPDSQDSLARLEREVAGLMRKVKDDPALSRELRATSGSERAQGHAWALGQVYWYGKVKGEASLDAIAEAHRLPKEALVPLFDEVVRVGYGERDGDSMRLTPAGSAEFDRLRDEWRQWLDTRLQVWDLTDPADRELFETAVNNIGTRLLLEDEAGPVKEQTSKAATP